MLSTAQFFIQDKLVEIDSVSIAEMNFGQLQRYKSADLVEFKIEIPFNDFIHRHRSFFTELAEETKLELSQGIENEIDELKEYINLGLPEIEDLITKHPFAFAELIDVFGYDILIEFSRQIKNQHNSAKYLIVFIEGFKASDKIEVTGYCIKMSA